MGFHLSLMLCRALQELGRRDSVIAVSRFGSAESQADFAAAGCDVRPADLADERQVASLPDVENVFFLAGIKFGSSQNPDSLRQMNVEMPRTVADRFRRSSIVALSTGCVYSFTTPESGGSTESSPTDPPGAYAESCLGREQAFVEAGRLGTRSSIIRLNYSIDLRYGVLVDIAQAVMAGRPVDLTTGYVNVIWQGDAIAHIVQALPHAAAPPEIFNVTGADVLRVRDLAHAFAVRFGVEAQLTGRESDTAWLNNPAKSHRLFGPPAVSTEQLVDWVADWLKRGSPTLNKPTHFEARDGKY
ncbi:MAG: NAD(P)-dependent oxidoreductase [Planctomycetaceae bacterium]